MKTRISLLLAAAVFAGSPLMAAPSADGLIKEHLKAIGGVEAAKKLKTRQMKGVIDIPSQGLSAEMTVMAKAPNKQRTEVDIPGMGKVVEGYDGKIAWSQNPWTGLIEKSGGQLKQAAEQADFYRDVELLTRYESWTLKGQETIDGKPTHVLEGKSKEGRTDVMYLDVATHLILQLKSETVTDQGTIPVVTKPSDYREVDGLKLPFLIQVNAGPEQIKMTMKEVKHGLDLDDKLFAKPSAGAP